MNKRYFGDTFSLAKVPLVSSFFNVEQIYKESFSDFRYNTGLSIYCYFGATVSNT